MPDVTQILNRVEQGDPKGAEELLPLVYGELRRLAAAKMSHENPGQTLQATALVHEAWLRLAASRDQTWDNKGHFFGAAAEAMRRILVDKARRKRAQKHGANAERVEFDCIELAAPLPDERLLALDEALTELSREDPEAAELVKLRWFVGLPHRESAAVMGLSHTKADQVWLDLRLLIAQRIQQIYASRPVTIGDNHKTIPLEENKEVLDEINSFQTKEKAQFLVAYKRSGLYRDMIVEELRKEGLPEELSWLPLIESGFQTHALSHSRALGLWQFIASTGYKFGLERNAWVDDRMDPQRSTKAAIAYLKELHGIFGDWTTALAAYNCWEGTVLRVIKGQKIGYLDNFWDAAPSSPPITAPLPLSTWWPMTAPATAPPAIFAVSRPASLLPVIV